MIFLMKRAAALFRRWREDRATMLALERLDERSRHELDALVRRHSGRGRICRIRQQGPECPQRRAAAILQLTLRATML